MPKLQLLGICWLSFVILFWPLSHQPPSALSSMPDAQLANEPMLACCQAARLNFTPQKRFQWIKPNGSKLSLCLLQLTAFHGENVWKIIKGYYLIMFLFMLQNKQGCSDYLKKKKKYKEVLRSSIHYRSKVLELPNFSSFFFFFVGNYAD